MPLNDGRWIANHAVRRDFVRNQMRMNYDDYRERTPRYPEIGRAFGQALASGNTREINQIYRQLPAEIQDTMRQKFSNQLISCHYCGHLHIPDPNTPRHPPAALASNWRDTHYCDICCGPAHSTSVLVYSTNQGGWVIRRHASPMYNTYDQFVASQPVDYVNADYNWTGSENYNLVDVGGRYALIKADIYRQVIQWIADHAADIAAHRSGSPTQTIGGYHSSKQIVRKLNSQYDAESPPLLVGLEMEVEVSGYRDEAAKTVRDAFNKNGVVYCGTERDGSLSTGFEIVTSYTGLDIHEKHLHEWEKIMADEYGQYISIESSCGLHVHLDRADINAMHEYRLSKFMHDRANEKFMEAIARRGSSSFAKKVDKSHAKRTMAVKIKGLAKYKSAANIASGEYARILKQHVQAKVTYGQDRYEAVNFTNNKTIEFRLFRGSTSKNEIMAAAEFARMVWLFTRDTPEKELTWQKFVNYVCQQEHKRDTRYLRAYMKKHVFFEGIKIPASKYELNYFLADYPRTVVRQAKTTDTLQEVVPVRAEAPPLRRVQNDWSHIASQTVSNGNTITFVSV